MAHPLPLEPGQQQCLSLGAQLSHAAHTQKKPVIYQPRMQHTCCRRVNTACQLCCSTPSLNRHQPQASGTTPAVPVISHSTTRPPCIYTAQCTCHSTCSAWPSETQLTCRGYRGAHQLLLGPGQQQCLSLGAQLSHTAQMHRNPVTLFMTPRPAGGGTLHQGLMVAAAARAAGASTQSPALSFHCLHSQWSPVSSAFVPSPHRPPKHCGR